MNLNTAIEGFFLDCEARRLSANTLDGYAFVIGIFRDHIGGETEVSQITPKEIKVFLNSFPLVKAKTIVNYHTVLSSLWTFMLNENMVTDHVMRKVTRPKSDKVEIQPFSEMEIKVLFASIEKTRPYKRLMNEETTTHTVYSPERMRAMLAILFDTGIRASELVNLKIEDVNLKEKDIKIILGKGRKTRIVQFESRTAKAIWQYLRKERPKADGKEYLFITKNGFPFDRKTLNKLINRLGKRAEILPCGPHRFRHTFAVMYLRNGGDVITLQKLLGHESRDMTNRYLALSQADFKRAHRMASPMENLNLGF